MRRGNVEVRGQRSEVRGFIQGKKGQVGDTVTWFIATVVIIAMLLFFIFGASMLGSTKTIGKHKASLTSRATYEGDDVFLKKSIFSFFMIENSKTKTMINKYFISVDEEDKSKVSAKKMLQRMANNYAKRK